MRPCAVSEVRSAGSRRTVTSAAGPAGRSPSRPPRGTGPSGGRRVDPHDRAGCTCRTHRTRDDRQPRAENRRPRHGRSPRRARSMSPARGRARCRLSRRAPETDLREQGFPGRLPEGHRVATIGRHGARRLLRSPATALPFGPRVRPVAPPRLAARAVPTASTGSSPPWPCRSRSSRASPDRSGQPALELDLSDRCGGVDPPRARPLGAGVRSIPASPGTTGRTGHGPFHLRNSGYLPLALMEILPLSLPAMSGAVRLLRGPTVHRDLPHGCTARCCGRRQLAVTGSGSPRLGELVTPPVRRHRGRPPLAGLGLRGRCSTRPCRSITCSGLSMRVGATRCRSS